MKKPSDKAPLRPLKKRRRGVVASALAILDPYEVGPYDFKKDSSHLLLLGLSRRGTRIFYSDPSSFLLDHQGLKVRTRQVTVLESEPFFTFHEEEVVRADRFDLILMRKDPPVDASYLHAALCLETVSNRVWVINHPKALRDWNEKLIIFNFPRWIPPTLVTADKREIDLFVAREGGTAVIKLLDSYAGSGVKKLVRPDPDYLTLLDDRVLGGRRLVMVQRYLQEIARGEKRVFMIEGKPWGALLRGEHFALAPLTRNEKKLCADLTPFLKKNGIFFAGVDLIGEKLIEINITSPGLLWEWNEVDNRRHEEEIVDVIERRVRHRNF